MRPLHNLALFTGMQVVVIGCLFGYPVWRHHDVGRSVTCSITWSVASVILWIVMTYQRRYFSMLGLVIAAMTAAVGSHVLYSLGVGTTAPICMFSALTAGLGSAAMWWRDRSTFTGPDDR